MIEKILYFIGIASAMWWFANTNSIAGMLGASLVMVAIVIGMRT